MDMLNGVEPLSLIQYKSDLEVTLDTAILRLLSNSRFKSFQLYHCWTRPRFLVSPSIIPSPAILSPPPALESLILMLDSDMSVYAFLLHPTTALHLRSLKHLRLSESFATHSPTSPRCRASTESSATCVLRHQM
ncbi:hypothetical protein C8J57DRAFT_1521544 [Mycena rebaudengoi]|nr:hypothetical protein C8J57DRAFT_1521544 [Mycena rebaudengoi]